MGGGDGRHRAPWLAEVGGVECYVVMMADGRFLRVRIDL